MLKIKSNINELTIIFFEKIWRKINAKKFSVPALSFFQLQCHCSLPFSVSALPLFFFFFLPFFSFQFTCALFFSLKTFFSAQNNSLFSPKTFFSAQNNSLFSPKTFFSAQTFFNFFFQPKHFCFSPKPFSVQPTPLFQPLFVLFQPFFLFVGSVFSAAFLFVQHLLFFFLFQRLILFFVPTSKAKNILFRCFTFLLFE